MFEFNEPLSTLPFTLLATQIFGDHPTPMALAYPSWHSGPTKHSLDPDPFAVSFAELPKFTAAFKYPGKDQKRVAASWRKFRA